MHHLLEWPWEQPVRAAAGAAILTIFAVLTLAGGNDVIAVFLDLRVESLTVIFQVLVIVLPIVVAVLTYLLCRARLRRPAPDELAPRDATSGDSAGGGGAHGPRHAGVALRRTADGGFEEVEA